MEVAIGLGLIGILGYTIWNDATTDENGLPESITRKRLCDYYATGGVYEEVKDVISSGRRLLEVHLYADENGKPIVAKKPLNLGYDYAYDYWTFDSVCVDLIQAWESSEEPFILSIVPHSVSNVTLNQAAECIKTTVRRHLVKGVEPSTPLDDLKNRLIIVSDNVRGSELGELINLSWSESKLRRILYAQAMYPRDEYELIAYNRSAITIVAPDSTFGKETLDPRLASANGCQWLLFENSTSSKGFVEKPAGLQ
jgi:hypothetical protein